MNSPQTARLLLLLPLPAAWKDSEKWKKMTPALALAPKLHTELKKCKPQTPQGHSSLRPWGHQHWVYTSLGRPAPLPHPSYQV
jgi:hypothetical protein